MTAENMSKRFIKDMDTAFEKWKPRKRLHYLKHRSYNEKNLYV